MPSVLGTNRLAEVAGLITDFFEKLAGSDGIVWLSAFKDFLRKEPCWVKPVKVAKKVKNVVKKVLTPFITIQIGGTTADQLIADIEAMPTEVSSYAKSMTANEAFTVSKEAGNVDLVAISIAELDLKMRRTDEFMTDEFCAKWSAEHLDGYVIELCQPEDGPQLRKQWKNQPKGTVVWLAMNRMTDSDGDPCVFCVGRRDGGEWWLDGYLVDDDDVWILVDRFVFRLRKI